MDTHENFDLEEKCGILKCERHNKFICYVRPKGYELLCLKCQPGPNDINLSLLNDELT